MGHINVLSNGSAVTDAVVPVSGRTVIIGTATAWGTADIEYREPQAETGVLVVAQKTANFYHNEDYPEGSVLLITVAGATAAYVSVITGAREG